MMKLLFALAFIGILGALAAAGVSMLRGGRSPEAAPDRRMFRALAARVAISVLLFACILIAWRLGWIHPTGLPLGR